MLQKLHVPPGEKSKAFFSAMRQGRGLSKREIRELENSKSVRQQILVGIEKSQPPEKD